MSLHTSIKVRWSELDPYHHVNHAVYLTYLESARLEALDEIGFGMDHLREEACQIVVTEMAIRFHRSAVAGDLLDIETEMLEVRRASTRWRQTIRRADEVFVTAELVGAITDLSGRPRRLPDGFAAALETILAPHPAM